MLEEILEELRAANSKAHDALRRELSRLRTGRANPSMLDGVRVDYYGTPTPIASMATVSVPEPRMLQIKVWERGQAKFVDKAIRESGLGLNPSMIGEMIRVPMPPLSEERRKELAKLVKGEGEDAKVAVRNLRRDANTHLKDLLKAKGISEDDERRAQDDIQKLTDRFVVEIDKLLQAKEQEIMTV